jgi:hypothetical protein
VLEDGLFVGRWQLAGGVDRGRILHLLPVVSDLEVPGTHGRLSQGNEHEPVPGRHPDLNGAERWQVCARVDVDSLQLPDLVAVGVNNVVAPPLPDIARLEHARLPLRGIACALSHSPHGDAV